MPFKLPTRSNPPSWYTRAGHGSLADNFSGRNNTIGLIRLVAALLVVVSHASPVGFGYLDPGAMRQGVAMGGMAVVAFFTLSGFLITRSALRLRLGRYLWARALRILPGLWLCVVITAFIVAPLLAMYQHGGHLPGGFWHAKGDSPFRYVEKNMWTSLGQFDVSGVLSHAIKAGSAHNGAFDGALWTLAYEATCYLVVGVLAVTAVLKRSPLFLVALALLFWICILQDLWRGHGLIVPQNLHGTYLVIPYLGHYMGGVDTSYLIYLGFPFTLGALCQLYINRIPINDVLGYASMAVFTLTLFVGGYFAFGIPALAYALIWLSVRLPRTLQKVGRKRDLSYGLYIYGFVWEQVLAVLHVNNHGYWVYMPTAVAGSAVLALFSWYVIEHPALKLKDWSPGFTRFRRTSEDDAPAEVSTDGTTEGPSLAEPEVVASAS